jgi:hypothetical protein
MKDLGKAEGKPVWSPDAGFLLDVKPQVSCWATLYGMSLQVIDVASGKRSLVKSSHCGIITGGFWMNAGAVQ